MIHFCDTTTSTNNKMTPEDELDERWDGNLGYYHAPNPTEQQKELALEVLFRQNLNINQPFKEVSPPISVKSDGCINTAYFREDLDENYFHDSDVDSPIIQIDTVPTPVATPSALEKQDVDYLTTYKDDEDEDLSIMALNDLSPNECIAVLNKQDLLDAEFASQSPAIAGSVSAPKPPPASLEDYHLDLVQYYTDALMRKTDPHTISPSVMQSVETTLPPMYKSYLLSVRKSLSVPYPCL